MFRNVYICSLEGHIVYLILSRFSSCIDKCDAYVQKAYTIILCWEFPFLIICILHVNSFFLQVHALFTNCGFGWSGSACHCGIAIRSRNSLFVLRTCEIISRNDKYLLQQPVTELKSCDDSDLLIDQHGNEYKVVCYGEFST